MQRIPTGLLIQGPLPLIDDRKNFLQIDSFVEIRIFAQIGFGEAK